MARRAVIIVRSPNSLTPSCHTLNHPPFSRPPSLAHPSPHRLYPACSIVLTACPHRHVPRSTTLISCIISIMALNNSLTARLDDLRSRNPARLHSENTTGQNTPSFRYSGSFMSPPQVQTPIDTPNLQRRFTTDLSKMQQIVPFGQQANQGGSVDRSATVSASSIIPPMLWVVCVTFECRIILDGRPSNMPIVGKGIPWCIC